MVSKDTTQTDGAHNKHSMLMSRGLSTTISNIATHAAFQLLHSSCGQRAGRGGVWARAWAYEGDLGLDRYVGVMEATIALPAEHARTAREQHITCQAQPRPCQSAT